VSHVIQYPLHNTHTRARNLNDVFRIIPPQNPLRSIFSMYAAHAHVERGRCGRKTHDHDMKRNKPTLGPVFRVADEEARADNFEEILVAKVSFPY
jgi:hypothetical protein